MEHLAKYKDDLSENGFAIVDDIYTEAEVQKILAVIDELTISADKKLELGHGHAMAIYATLKGKTE